MGHFRTVMRRLIYSMGVSLDEYRLFVNPSALDGGTPYLPALDGSIDLVLAETRTFGSGVVYVRYRRV
jgi:dihydrofolate reductase